MAQLTIEINAKPYVVGCEDGQEAHLRALAEVVDARVREIAPDAGALGETRLMLMAALMLADEAAGLKGRIVASQTRAEQAEKALEHAEEKLISAIDAATRKIETLAAG